MRTQAASGRNFAVVSGHPLATGASLDVLKKGGNPVDAALAGAAVLTVALPHACTLGGDCFILVHAKPDCRRETIQAAESLGGRVWTCQLDDTGLMTWEDSPSPPEQIEAIRRRIQAKGSVPTISTFPTECGNSRD